MNAGYTRANERVSLLNEDHDSDSDAAPEPSTSRSSTGIRGRGQMQNIKSSRVYIFGENEVYDDDHGGIEFELPEIRSRKATKPQESSLNGNSMGTEDLVFEREIAEDDSLQSIALQYGCPVSELKWLNKLISDQDFFALTSIKVPMKRYGLLSELVKQDKPTNVSSKGKRKRPPNGAVEEYIPNDLGQSGDSGSYPDNYLSDPENQQLLIRTLSIRDNINTQSNEAENFLSKMDKDLKQFRLSANSFKPSLQEVAYSLTEKRIQPMKKNQNWTDCGLSWCKIVVIAIIVGLLLPLLGGLYYYFRHHQHH